MRSYTVSVPQMNKGRKKGIALPSGRSFSFNQSDFSGSNLFTDDQYNKNYIDEDNVVQSPARRADDSKKVAPERERRCSASSMTLPLGPERRRKNSLLSSSKSQGHMMRHDIESHFIVILGSPAVGKTGRIKCNLYCRVIGEIVLFQSHKLK